MKDRVRLGGRWIGTGEPVFVIAEAGANHDQKWDRAKALIEAAAAAGADAVKFQLYSADDLYPPGTAVHDAVKATELPPEWVPGLAEYAGQCALTFLASAFGAWAIDMLTGVDVPAHKMASSEAVNLPLLKYAAATGKPILLSTGMCDLADVHEAVEVIRSEGNTDIVLLQCTSLYPTEPRHVHLRVMDMLRAAFQLPAGFSDHTTDVVIPAAAVARGACVIEKHLTLSRQLAGPDHGYALEPAEFRRMVDGIRATEAALGSPVKMLLPEEAQLARRESIRAARDIQAGEILTPELLVVERPAGGLRPRFLRAILGRRASGPIAKGAPITWEKVEALWHVAARPQRVQVER